MAIRGRAQLRFASAAPLFGWILLTSITSGCLGTQRIPTIVPAHSIDAPRLIHVVGWQGPVAGDRDFLLALHEAGCQQAMETFDWTADHDGLLALWYAQHSSKPSAQLAARILELRAIDATRPMI